MSLQSCSTLCNTVARQAPLSTGFSRQELRSGLPFSWWGSPKSPARGFHIFTRREKPKILTVNLSSHPSLLSQDQFCDVASPGTKQGRLLLRAFVPDCCSQLTCAVVSDSWRPHGLWPTRLFCPWDSPWKNTGVGCHALLQGIFPTQGWNPHLPHCRWILYQLSHHGSPRILEWVPYPFSRGSSQPRNWTGVSGTAGGFFTSWATREAQPQQPGSRWLMSLPSNAPAQRSPSQGLPQFPWGTISNIPTSYGSFLLIFLQRTQPLPDITRYILLTCLLVSPVRI